MVLDDEGTSVQEIRGNSRVVGDLPSVPPQCLHRQHFQA